MYLHVRVYAHAKALLCVGIYLNIAVYVAHVSRRLISIK